MRSATSNNTTNHNQIRFVGGGLSYDRQQGLFVPGSHVVLFRLGLPYHHSYSFPVPLTLNYSCHAIVTLALESMLIPAASHTLVSSFIPHLL